MSKRILCKFFAHGACLKGDSCEFLHDWKAPPNMICTYYQKGACSYGSRCRYDHVKIPQPHQSAPSLSDIPTSTINLSGTSYIIPERSNTLENPIEYSWSENSLHHPVIPERSNTLENPIEYSWSENSLHHPVLENNNDLWYSGDIDPSDRPICSFAAAGNCPRGDSCPHVHGDVCPTCGKQCLHPYRPQERAEHMTSCEKRQKHLEALRRSQEIECSVCLERVLSKTVLSERKFGILSECDHPFCVSCIRNWRGSSSSGFDVNSALRSCPICRKLSYFVIPSVIWYFSQEEKQEIVDSYKSKLSSIDCKHFNFGNGTCPFGTSCFYKHAYRDGRIEEVALRHLGSEDGSTVIARNIRLSDFLGNMRIR